MAKVDHLVDDFGNDPDELRNVLPDSADAYSMNLNVEGLVSVLLMLKGYGLGESVNLDAEPLEWRTLSDYIQALLDRRSPYAIRISSSVDQPCKRTKMESVSP